MSRQNHRTAQNHWTGASVNFEFNDRSFSFKLSLGRAVLEGIRFGEGIINKQVLLLLSIVFVYICGVWNALEVLGAI